ncbi:hypothetical protein RIF29_19474 [Crotalaria pallida]|uniref:GDSL esterase/lipase n=1 Tax=Crotalaria pallida TaxID=3830 RepID=A0AAN9F3L8_CROPI
MASSSRFATLILSLVLMVGVIVPKGRAEARAFFVFGDSLVDTGNNNYLVTLARADAPPYGIDHPTHRPTGRFSNGYNIADLISYISQKIGAEFPLPYLSPELTGEKLLRGANFASAGVGILNDTGIQFLNIIRMFQQLEYFQEYQNRTSVLIGASQTKTLVNQSLVLITVGGNDFVNNYYLVPNSARSLQYPSLREYVKLLISDRRHPTTVASEPNLPTPTSSLVQLETHSCQSHRCPTTPCSGKLFYISDWGRSFEVGAREVRAAMGLIGSRRRNDREWQEQRGECKGEEEGLQGVMGGWRGWAMPTTMGRGGDGSEE